MSASVMAGERPLVSVVMPAFNAADLLPEAVESVLAQTYGNWELIIVDDASTDDTLAIAQGFASRDARVGVIALGQNSGARPGVPKNLALAQVRGELVAFLDSDDVWLPEKLERQVGMMQAAPDVVMSYVPYRLIVDGDVQAPVLPKLGNRFEGWCFRAIYLRSVIVNSGVMVRRNALAEAGPLDEDRRVVEDNDMWLRLAMQGQIAFLDGPPLLHYRVVGGSHSSGILTPLRRMIAVRWKHRRAAGLLLFGQAALLQGLHVCVRGLRPLKRRGGSQ